jgi:hypothetical protein
MNSEYCHAKWVSSRTDTKGIREVCFVLNTYKYERESPTTDSKNQIDRQVFASITQHFMIATTIYYLVHSATQLPLATSTVEVQST